MNVSCQQSRYEDTYQLQKDRHRKMGNNLERGTENQLTNR